jgi:hypothetical protein
MRCGSRGRFVGRICCTAHYFGRTSCLGTLHILRTQRMQYVIGIQIWHKCKNYVKNLVPDSNTEVLSHQQNFKTEILATFL